MLSGFAQGLVETGGFEGIFVLSLAMIMGHALGDYPLQGAFLASCKNRNTDSSIFFGGSNIPSGLWIHALTAHSLIQAGLVWIITGSFAVSMIELVIHWITDFVRCEGWISYNVDQAIHAGCKIAYAVLLVYGIL